MSSVLTELSALSREEKLALLARLAGERAPEPAATAAMATMVEAEGPEVFPLAFAQQRFWFLDQLDPGSYLDNIFRALRLLGPLDHSAVERALRELTCRHEALRTRFPVEAGEPCQVVEPELPGGPLELGVLDLSGLPADEIEPRAVAIAGEESRRPFDLARGPLFRARLLRLGPRDHALLLGVHHIVCDGWSLGLLLHDFAVLYGASATGRPSPLPALRGRYGDFAREQRARLRGEALDRELAFWRERLAGAPAVLELPTDHPRRPMASPRGDVVAFAITEPTAVRLKALVQSAGATPFMAFLAFFDLLLFRYTEQEDFVVGIPVANRHRTELESVVGCFASTLLVRAGVARTVTFRDLLERVRSEALAVLAHSDLPFEKLVEELQPDRNLSHNPLFQVMFALQGAGAGKLCLPGLELAALPVARGLAKLDLTLDVTESATGFTGYFEHSTDLFERPTIVRLAGHFQALVTAALASPDRELGELPMLSPTERRQVLVDWNQPYDGPPPTILDRIAEQARRAPATPAVLWGDERLTFAELERQANRLARRLRRLGVGPETSVGVCVERSLQMPLVLLAVLKSGGAWVPLDPDYPQERLALMIEDTAMPVLLTEERLADRLPPAAGHALICVDRLDLAAEDAAPPDWPIHPESLAYIVYTSGSTGRPKGVAVPHRAMINHVEACARRYRMGPGDRVLQFTSISFDITSEEIFPTWIRGGAVVPRPPGLFPSFDELAALIERYGITAMDLPTAYWHEWVGEMVRTQKSPPPSLRLVVIGTEAALPERVAEWLALVGDRVRLNNSYASTEATVTAVVFEPAAADVVRFRAGDRVPVGRTLHNCCAYVLDAGFEPVPAGVPGDVYIGGPNVSRGYANWPDRTAASFVPDPFAAAMGYGAGQRMYRQGDVGRWLPSGELEYLGRRDDQVKIRGFRVEPAEVGAVLARHPAVKDSIVVVRSDGPLGKRLVGYATLAAGETATPSELRGFLRASLPDHMVPAALVVVESLPLTANGRVDQRALPEPAADRLELEGVYVAPQTAVEQILEGIWCEVLGVARVGAHDDFFDLGGHSLLGTQVVSRAREQLRVELPLRALFESPTIADLARRIEELRRAGTAAAPPRLVPVPREGDLPLSFAQQRLWFLDGLEPGTATYNIPLALHFQGGLEVPALAAALGEVARRHESLRTTFAAIDGRPSQIVHPPGPAALPLVDLGSLDPERRAAEVRRLMAAEARRPFALEQGPLLRTTLLRLASDEDILLVTMHHIVSDGWSVPIFVRETASVYAAMVAGRPPALPALPVQYADFAHRQRDWLQGPVLAAELAHWRERLRGMPHLIELPADRPRPAVRTWQGAVLRTVLESGLAAGLKTAGRRQGATPFMVLLAGFAALLHRYSGQESFAVGVAVAGRNRVEIEPLIGFFVNTLVLRCDVDGGANFLSLLARTREAVLDADAHQDVPFEKLVEELTPERSLSHSPLLQVTVTYLDIPREEFAAEGLRMTSTGIASGTTKFDLTLSVRAAGERTFLDLEYSTELFDPATIGRLAKHLLRLLAAALAAPEQRVAELPLLSAPERQQLLEEWNDSAAGEAADTVPHWFEAAVVRWPLATALEAGEVRLSYGELDAQANRLAHRLLGLGVGREALVGVCLERSADLVVALLAVFKAGAAFLPLDPAYPQDRLAYVLEDSGAEAVISEQRLAAGLPCAGRALVLLDEERERLSRESAASPAVEVRPDDLAYVIYTSGSTGRPKGVLVEHGNLANVLRASRLAFGFDETDVMPALAPFSFDIFLFELLNPLVAGGTAILVSMAGVPDLAFLAGLLQRVTRLHAVPALMQQVVEQVRSAPRETGHPRLRTLFTGGDRVPASLLTELRETFPAVEVRVLYGPTEGTIIASSHRVPAVGETQSLLGRPLADAALLLADRYGRPVPVGVPGEIWIGGAGVARGYLGRPELTAERFTPAPWGPRGARLYRSGDLARRLPDGNLEFLGRIDHQVKIRGFRVELGEIETALARLPALAQAVVLAREDAPGTPQLVAYCVPAEGESPDAADLRAALRTALPDYMVPAAFVLLEALPISANGKVDRTALRAPEGRSALGRDFVPPAGPVQERLAGIWAEVLHCEQIGAQDNFFELGGHSLLATQVMSRLRQAFGVDLPLRAIFDTPTVAGLAEAIIQRELERADADLLAKLLSELEG